MIKHQFKEKRFTLVQFVELSVHSWCFPGKHHGKGSWQRWKSSWHDRKEAASLLFFFISYFISSWLQAYWLYSGEYSHPENSFSTIYLQKCRKSSIWVIQSTPRKHYTYLQSNHMQKAPPMSMRHLDINSNIKD